MRVLLLIKGLGRGGAEQIVVSTARLGNQSFFDYEVAYLLPEKSALVSDLESAGIVVHCLGTAGRAWPWRLESLVRNRGYDIVHAHSPVPAVASRFFVGRSAYQVYTEHNVWERYRWPTRHANARTFARNDFVIAVSDSVKRSIRSHTRGRVRPPLETIRHGVAPSFSREWEASDGVRQELGFGDGAPLVVTVANFKPSKGHEHLLKAAKIVLGRHPDVCFVLAGVGETEERMKRLASTLGLNRNVAFVGRRDDASRLMRAADVFVLPSEHEGLPIALLEAMMLGRASVATTAGGIPEVITNDESGLLVPCRDERALAEAITALLDDSDRRARYGKAARVRARDFDMSVATRRIESIYAKLAANLPPRNVDASRRSGSLG
jgi:glycosyltransferase involved in cell wall biosynthesis